MADHADDFYLTIDGSSDISAEINNIRGPWSYDTVETTNMDSSGKEEHAPTVKRQTLSFDLVDPVADESTASSVAKLLWDGSVDGGGDGKFGLIAQKVTSGTTPGTANTADPLYTWTDAVMESTYDPLMASVGSLVGAGQTITFRGVAARTTS